MPKKSSRIVVKSVKHDDALRKNLPTIEDEGFVPDQIKAPAKVTFERASATLYPRDKTADPQLVWNGKDEEDSVDVIAVNSLPIYVHEHITPQKIIQSLIDDTQGRVTAPELFARDFNGLTEDQRLKYYEYEGHWTNRLVLGDSLAAMASLSEREGLRSQVQTIYFDPPYGVNFRSNWQVAANRRDVKDGRAEGISTDPEQIKAYRDTWKDGIHSYLSYLRDRLTAARDLLKPQGSIFVQISEENVHVVRALLDEIFGSKNNAGTIIFFKTSGLGSTMLPRRNDYLLWYAKDFERVKFRQLYYEKSVETSGAEAYSNVLNADGSIQKLTEFQDGKVPKGSRIFRYGDLTKPGPGNRISFEFNGKIYTPGKRWWGQPPEGMARLAAAGRIAIVGKNLAYIRFLDDFAKYPMTNVWTDTGIAGFASEKIYVVQTTSKVVERCILMTTDPGDLVLDPTCGSGTTAFCAEKWGRRWITIDTSKVALMLARQRLMSAKYPYYCLVDSHEGRLQEARLSGLPIESDPPPALGAVSRGFVYERSLKVSPETFSGNPDIYEGIPADKLLAAIRRYAKTVNFTDRPIIEKSALRVSGPFTVESLAANQARPLDDDPLDNDGNEQVDFIRLIIENVQTSGLLNGDKNSRIRFETIEPFPGEFVNAIGTTDDHQRFALAIGPKYGTISKSYIRSAAREAVDEGLADTLAVFGFAFEDAARTESFGKLLALKVGLNHDLQLGELLKKSKGANLFQVYGDPDVELSELADGRLEVRVRGLDIFDPQLRELRSADTTKIQAWFIDTSYDGERFMVRQVYFLGDDEVFDDLQKALKGEIDEAGWLSIYSDKSRPFEKPASGKIAVKIITVYGDEAIVVLKV